MPVNLRLISGRSRRRQKGVNGKAFAEELDLAGATSTAAPVFFQFTDIALPLRFKG